METILVKLGFIIIAIITIIAVLIKNNDKKSDIEKSDYDPYYIDIYNQVEEIENNLKIVKKKIKKLRKKNMNMQEYYVFADIFKKKIELEKDLFYKKIILKKYISSRELEEIYISDKR